MLASDRLLVQPALAELHTYYSQAGQAEREDQAAMVAAGHPAASTYRRLRRLFERLPVCSGHRARLFSYADRGERSQYRGPGMRLRWCRADALARFKAVYPGHRDWLAYIEAAGAAGWPDAAGALLDPGLWMVDTRSDALVADLAGLRLMGAHVSGVQPAPTQVSILLGRGPEAVAQLAALLRVLRRHHGRWLLPLGPVDAVGAKACRGARTTAQENALPAMSNARTRDPASAACLAL